MASIILSMTDSLLRWHYASITGKLFESAPEPDQRANILDYLETRLETSLMLQYNKLRL